MASLESLTRRAEELSRATGQSPDEAAAVVVEDLERASLYRHTAETGRTLGLAIAHARSIRRPSAENANGPRTRAGRLGQPSCQLTALA